MLAINYLSLSSDHLLDLDKLKAKGWVHLLGLREEVLEGCLTKVFHNVESTVSLTVSIHSHTHSEGEYQEIFVYPKVEEYTKPKLKGQGEHFSVVRATAALEWLSHEFEGCER